MDRYSSNLNRLTVADGGNVGIGTTSPTTNLDVRGGMIVAGDTPSSAYGAQLEVYRNGSTSELLIHQDDASASTKYAQLHFRNGGNDTYIKTPTSGQALIVDTELLADAFVIETGGNVGIGTSSPASKLHISSSNFNDHITLGRDTQELGITVSGNQVLVEGGLSPFSNDANDLGRSDKHWRDLYITDNIHVSQSGTLSVTGSLDVSGDITIDDWGSVSASLSAIQTAGGVNGTGTATYLTKWVDSDTVTSSGMFQAASGNFSIGVSTPNAKLSVVNDISIGTSATDVLRLHNESGVGTIDGYSTRNIAFGSATNGEVMRIDNTNGRVGIGTTNPSEKLEIAGSGNQKLLVNRTDGDNFYIDAQNGQIRLRGSNNIYMGVSGDLLTVTNTNVGIGTTSPAEKLHVNGDVRVDGNDGVATKKIRSSYFSNTQNLDLVAGSSADIILTSDNVGIGTTSPSAKLQVYGSGSTVLDIQGSQGQLFSITDDLTGTLLAISDISGVPIFGVEASGEVAIDGNLKIKSANITYQENIDVDSSAAETIATVNTGEYTGAFFDYTCVSGSNARIGTVMAISVNGSIEFTDNSTKDIGDTSGVTLSADISGGDMRLRASTTTNDWIIKTLIRTL